MKRQKGRPTKTELYTVVYSDGEISENVRLNRFHMLNLLECDIILGVVKNATD